MKWFGLLSTRSTIKIYAMLLFLELSSLLFHRFIGLLVVSFVVFLPSSLFAQSFQRDITLLLSKSEQIEQQIDLSPSLDTIVAILAYYATAPDTLAAHRLNSGPLVLQHYGNNRSMQLYFKEQGLDSLLWQHENQAAMHFSWLNSTARNKFLEEADSEALFSKNGLIDVGKIEQTFTQPSPPQALALRKAGEEAKLADIGAPSSNYISIALSGLSDWIGKRAQEELTYTFLTRLRERLNENGLNYLFPHTVAYLPTLNLINYKAILPSIRMAFSNDLNQLSLNLGEFLHFKDRDNYNDPAVYNLFLVYRLLDLGFRDVPLSDILSFTYAQLADSRLNTRKAIDLKLAEVAREKPEYSTITTAYERFTTHLAELELAMQNAKSELADYEDELAVTYGEDALRPLRPKINNLLNFDFANLLFSKEEAPQMIASWLSGEENYEYYLAHPNLSKYDELFSSARDSITADYLRAAGLTSIRELLLRRERPRARYGQFIEVHSSLDSLQAILDMPDAPTDEWALKNLLQERLKQETTYFQTNKPENEKIPLQLRYLSNMLEEVLPEANTAATTLAQLAAIEQRLNDLSIDQNDSNSPNYRYLFPSKLEERERYPSLLQKVEAVEAEFVQLQNALEKYSWDEAGDLIRAHRNAANFETVFGLGRELFFLLAKEENPSIEASLVGDFASSSEMSGHLIHPHSSQLLKGLAVERLNRVPGLAHPQAESTGRLIMDFTEQIQLLKKPLEGTEQEQRVQKRIRIVNFITSTISTIVEAPLLPNIGNEPGLTSLSNQLPGFGKIAAINDNLNELFTFSQEGNYRYAITNLLQLIELFGIVPSGSKKQARLLARKGQLQQQVNDIQSQLSQNKYAGLAFQQSSIGQISPADIKLLHTELASVEQRLNRLDTARINRERQRLFLYGTFMADVAAADTPDAFAAALNNVALPPGSSQLKRNKPFGLELNAYFGFSLAEEVLDLPENTAPASSLPPASAKSLALYVPVGVSMSWKTRYTQRSSYSLFFPLIDLGAVSAYRFNTANDRVQRLPQFTFQNVFAPGAHFKYNFANAPFSLGVGAQYGPGLRQIKPDGSAAINVSAIRYMLTFAVDVPIFSLSNKQ